MIAYLLRRLGLALITVWAISVLSFITIQLPPGDFATTYVEQMLGGANPGSGSRVDRGLGEVRERLSLAATEEQFQAVGLLCREVLISLGQTVYDASRHQKGDDVAPSATDAKRMLEGYLSFELTGSIDDGTLGPTYCLPLDVRADGHS